MILEFAAVLCIAKTFNRKAALSNRHLNACGQTLFSHPSAHDVDAVPAADIPDEEFETTMYWDLELDQSELTDEIFSEMELLEPYGANAPKPIIKLRTELSDGESHIFLGANNSHVKLFADGFTLIGFSLANKYIEESLPGVITAYGSVSYNSYRGNLTKQISLIDFDAA